MASGLVLRQIMPIVREGCGLLKRAKDTGAERVSTATAISGIKVTPMPAPTIWTSVDGFFDADPNHVASAQQFEELSYEEALEHSQRGARVVHPKAFSFLMQERIPLLVRNAERPDAPGTWIGLRETGKQGAASGGSR